MNSLSLLRWPTFVITLLLAFCLQGCSLAIPAGIQPVTNFELDRYLGTWYEIARFDYRFERGLDQVTATYSLQENGTVRVENAGWDSKKGKRKQVIGKAKFVSSPQVGHLKVSFFGPFYSSYVVFYLAPDYSVALVCGNSRDYCWILARKPVLTPKELVKYVAIAKQHGFAVERLIYPAPANP